MTTRRGLDTKGLACPLPVLRLRRAMKSLPDGATLHVEATDPATVPDFRTFCELSGNELVAWREADGIYRFTIRKSPGRKSPGRKSPGRKSPGREDRD